MAKRSLLSRCPSYFVFWLCPLSSVLSRTCFTNRSVLRFYVLIEVFLKITIFWDVMLLATSEQFPSGHPIHCRDKGNCLHLLCLVKTFTGDLRAYWFTRYTENPHHHCSNKQVIISTWVQRARGLFNQNTLHDDLQFSFTFMDKRYSHKQAWWTAHPPALKTRPSAKPTLMTLNNINWIVSRHNIKSVGLPPRNIPTFLCPVKETGDWRFGGHFFPPFPKCGQVYIG